MKNSWHGCHDRVALFYELFGWGSIGDLNGNVGTTLGIWDHRGGIFSKKFLATLCTSYCTTRTISNYLYKLELRTCISLKTIE